MNASFRRELVAQAVIVAAICAGGWFMFVQPRESEAQRLEETLRAAEIGTAGTPMEQLDAGLGQIAGIRDSLRSVEEASSAFTDQASLYDLVMRVASVTGVSVRSVSPVSTGRRDSENDSVQQYRTEALLDGAYGDVAAFIGMLHREGRSIRLVRLAISPLSNTTTPKVAASVTFDAFGFTIPAELRNLAVTQDDSSDVHGEVE